MGGLWRLTLSANSTSRMSPENRVDADLISPSAQLSQHITHTSLTSGASSPLHPRAAISYLFTAPAIRI